MESWPTLQDVARLAGVAKATASLALRDDVRISRATREVVRAAAEKIHYRPDPVLARVAACRWRRRGAASGATLAYVSNDHPGLRTELGIPIRVAAAEHADRLGYRLEHFRAEDYPQPTRLAQVLDNRGIRGVVVGQIFREDLSRRFPWERFAIVASGLGYYRPPVPLVATDHVRAMVRAWREAVRRGYRRIGLAMLNEFDAIDLLDKVSAALFCQARISAAKQLVPVGYFPLDDRRPFRRWLRRHRPDAVIGFNDTVYRWLHEEGYRATQRRFGYASLILTGGVGPDGRKLAGLQADLAGIGRLSVEQLDILLRGNRTGYADEPVTIHVPPRWCPGETLAGASAATGRRRIGYSRATRD